MCPTHILLKYLINKLIFIQRKTIENIAKPKYFSFDKFIKIHIQLYKYGKMTLEYLL